MTYQEQLNRDWKKEQAELREKFGDNPHYRHKLVEFMYEMQFGKPFRTEDMTVGDYLKLPF
ncbi:MAG: hypothetical protein IJA76_03035 [Clostridia bacterium]|nr:hypothetical protein [Clostridia bacterium]